MWGATPSRMGAGETLTPRLGTSANFSQTVGFDPDCFGEVFADFVFVNFKRGDKVDVADVVAAVVHVH